MVITASLKYHKSRHMSAKFALTTFIKALNIFAKCVWRLFAVIAAVGAAVVISKIYARKVIRPDSEE